METIRIDIATQEIGKTEKRWVWLELRDGSIKMLTYDIGDAAKTRNREDYEFWLIIPDKAMSLAAAFALLRDKEDNRWLTTPPHGLPRLVFDLLLDRYAGNSEATDELRDFCLAESISYEWASWP